MKKSPKTKKVVIYPERSFNVTDEILNMDFCQLKDFMGGRLATALFKGKFEDQLWETIVVASEWGKYSYHQELLKDGRGD